MIRTFSCFIGNAARNTFVVQTPDSRACSFSVRCFTGTQGVESAPLHESDCRPPTETQVASDSGAAWKHRLTLGFPDAEPCRSCDEEENVLQGMPGWLGTSVGPSCLDTLLFDALVTAPPHSLLYPNCRQVSSWPAGIAALTVHRLPPAPAADSRLPVAPAPVPESGLCGREVCTADTGACPSH